MDTGLSFNDRVIDITNSTLSTLDFIFKTTKPLPAVDSILPLYLAFVRSKFFSLLFTMRYFGECSDTFSEVPLLFNVSWVYPAQGFSHACLLNTFGVSSLELRKVQSDVRCLYNLLNNRVDAPLLLYRIIFLCPDSHQDTPFYVLLFTCYK